MKSFNGFFIAVEGTDFSGKTTLVGKLKAALEKAGYAVIDTRQPGGTPLAEQLRSLVKEKRDTVVSANTEYLIMQAARSDLMDNLVKPHLARGCVVISDRHDASTYAYQGMLMSEVTENISVQPELTLFMNRRPRAEDFAVAEERGENCRIEAKGLEFQQQCYDRYLDYFAIYSGVVHAYDLERYGFDCPEYDHYIESVVDFVDTSPLYCLRLKGTEAKRQFLTEYYEQTGIGIIPVGTCKEYIPFYDKFNCTVDSPDWQIEAEIEKYLGKGHKWNRGSRPCLPHKCPEVA